MEPSVSWQKVGLTHRVCLAEYFPAQSFRVNSELHVIKCNSHFWPVVFYATPNEAHAIPLTREMLRVFLEELNQTPAAVFQTSSRDEEFFDLGGGVTWQRKARSWQIRKAGLGMVPVRLSNEQALLLRRVLNDLNV